TARVAPTFLSIKYILTNHYFALVLFYGCIVSDGAVFFKKGFFLFPPPTPKINKNKPRKPPGRLPRLVLVEEGFGLVSATGGRGRFRWGDGRWATRRFFAAV